MARVRVSTVAVSSVSAVLLGLLITSSSMRGANEDNDGGGDNSRIAQGFANAPVLLNLRGKNRSLVGLGSYFVNVVGGTVFIPAHGDFPAIVSRNLRPEGNGLPEGHTFEEFLQIMRTGIDLDH